MGNVNSIVLVELILEEMKRCITEGNYVILPRNENI